MKKFISSVLLLTFMLTLVGCSEKHKIKITIPAGSTEAFVYSTEEFSPTKDTITILGEAGIPDTEVRLKSVNILEENVYEPTYLTHAMPVKMNVEKGAWYKIGVAIQNPSDEDIVVSVEIKGISDELRITEIDEAVNPN